jgi:hypothetical protein
MEDQAPLMQNEGEKSNPTQENTHVLEEVIQKKATAHRPTTIALLPGQSCVHAKISSGRMASDPRRRTSHRHKCSRTTRTGTRAQKIDIEKKKLKKNFLSNPSVSEARKNTTWHCKQRRIAL